MAGISKFVGFSHHEKKVEEDLRSENGWHDIF